MGRLAQDLRYGLRMLARAPGFSAIAILTLGLGIGVNTAIFSLVSPMLFEPLPFPHSERIVAVSHVYRGERQNGLNGTEVLYLLENQRSMQAVAAVDNFGDSNLSDAGPAARVKAAHVTHGYFAVFGVAPALGRGFLAGDDQPGAPLTAVLSDGLWRAQFHGDPDVLGQAFRMDGRVYTVIGVMPRRFAGFQASFEGFQATDLWTAMQPSEASLAPLGPNLDLLGRLSPGVTLEQANADLALERAGYRQLHPGDNFVRAEWGAESYHEVITGGSRTPLLLLLGAVGLVLLLACANLANLLLARATSRTREMAIRAAIGANPGRILRQLLTESLLLACLGAAVGWLLAWWSVPLLARSMPSGLALPLTGGLDLRALLYTAGLTVATGMLFGLAPALYCSRLGLQDNLKESAASSGSRGAGRARSGLIVAEVAVAFLLLAGAGLLIASLLQLGQVNLGFDTGDVLTVQTTLTGERQASDAATTRYTEQVLERLRRIPGISDAASVTGVPLTRGMNYPVRVPGHSLDRYSGAVEWRAISPEFFRTLHIALLQGRGFTASDTAAGAKVAIVSRAFAQHYWPGRSALGEVVTIPEPGGTFDKGPTAEIVGVASDIHENGVDSRPPFTLYVPQAQASDAINALDNHWIAMGFLIRGQGPGLARAARAAFNAVDPNQPVFNVLSLDQVKGASLRRYRFLGGLLGIFAGLALTLGGIGIYGVLSYAVAERTREIGIRMALGASREQILRQFVGDGLRLTAVGLGVGVAGALILTRLLSGFLFGVAPTDPTVLTLVGLTLLGLAWAASLRPAWQATRVDPLAALRGK